MLGSPIKKLRDFFADSADAAPVAELVQPDGKINFYSSNKKILNTFFGIMVTGTFVAMVATILYYVFAFASLYGGSSKFDWLLGIFSDFVVIMNFSLEESPYVVGDSSYPPIAIAILYPFALICKDAFANYRFNELTADELTAEIILHPQFWVAILLFFAICSILVVFTLSKLFGLKKIDSLKFGIITITSAPFVFAVMRGNTIYFALIFLILFLLFKDSGNAILREISYICLALAGAIKIYPLFFGVFLLQKKKIFASFRVGVYFALIFVLSFIVFHDDFNEVSPFIDNLGGFMSNEMRLLATNNLSISSLIYKILHFFIPILSAESTVYTVINLCALAIVFATSTYAAIATQSNFSRYAICFAIVVLIPTISYFYVIIFAILPFLEYIRVYSQLSIKKRCFYFFAFSFLFLTPFIVAKNFVVHALIITLILAIEIISVFSERKRLRQVKNS